MNAVNTYRNTYLPTLHFYRFGNNPPLKQPLFTNKIPFLMWFPASLPIGA